MNTALLYKQDTIRFRQWSGKNYAVFASIGKEVNIGHVDMDICNKASEKNNQTQSLTIVKSERLIEELVDQDEFLIEIPESQLHSLLTITASNGKSSQHCCILLIRSLLNFNLHPVSRMQSSIKLF